MFNSNTYLKLGFQYKENMSQQGTETLQNILAQSLLSQQANANNDQLLKPQESQLTPLQKLLDKVGGEHTYQLKIVWIFNMMWFVTAWVLVGQGFFFDDAFQCWNFQDVTQCRNQVCKLDPTQRAKAIKWHARSIIFQFENQYMICDNQSTKPILQSLLYVGSLLGFFIIPYIADNWGRKIALRISWGFFFFGILCMSLADSTNMLAMGQLLSGFGCNPAITLCYSFLNEQVLREKRQYYGVIIQLFLAIGECSIAFMFLPNYSWRVVFYILLGLIGLNWILINYVVQSPKFLISKSKKQTMIVLNQIAKRNKREQITQQQINQIHTIDESAAEGTSIYDLFKYKSLRWATLGGGMVFMAIQVIYYGTLLNLDGIGYSKLVNQEIIGISEALGYIGAQILINKLPRKKWSLVGMGLSSVFCFCLGLLTIFQNDSNHNIMKNIEVVGLILNRFVLCGFWALFYVYIAELYPTKVRSMGFGWASAVGTLGSTLAPYILFFSKQVGINSWIPPGIIGICGFACIFCLKETFKQPMYDDIEEVRLMGRWQLSDDDDGNQDQQKTDNTDK